MNKLFSIQYKDVSLNELATRLDGDYYTIIETLCRETEKNISNLTALEVHQGNSQYIQLCKKLLKEVLEYVSIRKMSFLPYVNRLAEKQKDGHDCSNCAGGCNLQHEMRLMELKESHHRIKDTLYNLEIASLPLYAETMFPDAYRVLRNQIALLENTMTELFFLEDSYLIPKVMDTQKIINAGSGIPAYHRY
jgi:hypothetical protein